MAAPDWVDEETVLLTCLVVAALVGIVLHIGYMVVHEIRERRKARGQD